MNEDLRADLARLVASVGAYVEWQRDTGASGFPGVPQQRPGLGRGLEATFPERDLRGPSASRVARSVRG